MNPFLVALACFTLLCSALGGTINHDQVQPFAQPVPITISEKAAVKYKPQLHISAGCESFPAVNAAGEITGGLKGTKGKDGCEKAPLGSQVYGRSGWYQDKWAMLYAWYFPKNFYGHVLSHASKKRHAWASMVLWIDNPALETSKLLGASLSQQDTEAPYQKMTEFPLMLFAGAKEHINGTEPPQYYSRLYRTPKYIFTYTPGSNITTRVTHSFGYPEKGWIKLQHAGEDGKSHDLIMWEQLTDAAREGLNSADFGDAKVPFNENNFQESLKQAYPF